MAPSDRPLQAYRSCNEGEPVVSYSRVKLYMGACGDNDKYIVPATEAADGAFQSSIKRTPSIQNRLLWEEGLSILKVYKP